MFKNKIWRNIIAIAVILDAVLCFITRDWSNIFIMILAMLAVLYDIKISVKQKNSKRYFYRNGEKQIKSERKYYD